MTDPAKLDRPSRECDLVMKGGVTSGVVYPGAVQELSAEFVFRSIGGTSAGALVAALTAAAEYQRRETGSGAGFAALGRLTAELTSQQPLNTSKWARARATALRLRHRWLDPLKRRVASLLPPKLRVRGHALRDQLRPERKSSSRSKLQALFEPAPQTSEIFNALDRAKRHRKTVDAPLHLYNLWRTIRKNADAFESNFYGLVSGHTEGPGEGLTDWLARLIQELAGRSVDDPPLTFADLWGAKSEDEAKRLHRKPWQRCINLQLLASCVTLGLQVHLPLVRAPRRTRADTWMFSRSEMDRLFPTWVLDSWTSTATAVPTENGPLFLFLPWHMPIVVAARISMSFPGLFSAIPLYLPNFTKGPSYPPQRCWFSDGGITSNFPVDLFDSPLPARPSFGFNLKPTTQTGDSVGESEMVLLTGNLGGSALETWHSIPDGGGMTSIGAFAARAFETMQNWSDTAQALIPGYRDRIVTVLIDTRTEGGLHFDMTEAVVTTLDRRGRCAARKLIVAYTTNARAAEALSWDAHRWVRLRTTLQVMHDELHAMARDAGKAAPTSSPLGQLMARIGCDPTVTPMSHRFRNEEDLTAALRLLNGLVGLAGGTAGDASRGSPRPHPSHRTWLRL